MGVYFPVPRTLWTLSASGLGTTLATGSGNSGGWVYTANQDYPSSSVDLGLVTDVTLFVTAGTATGTPSLTVQVDVFDSLGNPYLAVVKTAAITTAGAATPVTVGLHGASTGFLVLPQWARVSWTVTGAASHFAACEIALVGR